MRTVRFVARVLPVALLAASLGALAPAGATAPAPTVQHLHFSYGPVNIRPGQNNIDFSGTSVPKPSEDGWIVGIRPNIHLSDGTIPPVDVIHLHHAVWLNWSAADPTSPGLPQRFFAAGEEKTGLAIPSGYGYPYHASDVWQLNYMIHNLVVWPFTIYLDYDIDFVSVKDNPHAHLRPVHPVWMDVRNGNVYPVFDVHRNSGSNGQYTYPDMATNPYGSGPKLNEWTVPQNGVLVATAGHLHPGGLHTDLYVRRGSKSAHVFRSEAHYYEPAGPVSWDVSMTASGPNWAVKVRKGDVLRINVTYDSATASWYETMGIMIVWIADTGKGANPFTTTVDGPGVLTHGHLAENDNHGGAATDTTDPQTLPDTTAPSNTVPISNYEYEYGDLDGAEQTVPTVQLGHSLTYVNEDAPSSGDGTWHSITACHLPCNASTGIAYPLANAPIEFDSGQLGNFGAPTAGRLTWSTPSNLPLGTYSFFCRVHPFMRGAFRVVP